MNIFDVILLLIAFTLIFKSRMKYRVFKIVLIIGFLTSVIQVIMVGYKWQYIPIYIIFLSLAIGITLGIKFENKLLKGASFLFLLIIFTISTILVYYLPIPEFTIENKKYSVGYEEFHVVIDERDQPKAFYELSNLEASGKRELLVDVYYPSAADNEPIQLFKNADTNWGKTVVRYLNRTWGISIPEFLLSHLNLSYFDIGRDLEKLSNKSPVVIYTHGWAGEKIFATDQLITIASQGYVVIALDHTGLAMFTELPSGTIYNTGSTENSTKVYDVMYEMSLDIENTLSYLQINNYYADFSDISLIGHSTGGGSAHLYCLRNNCNSLLLQDPFFVPVVEELRNIELVTDTYFIYSEDWYNGYEDINELSEIEVFRNFVENKDLAEGYYMTNSAHYDFVAFGAISSLTKYTFLKGSIDYTDSLTSNNRFNLEALQNKNISISNYIKTINE